MTDDPDQETQQTPPTGPDEEDLFRAYAGPNAGLFMKAFRARAAGKVSWSVNWACLIATIPWMFFRKMHLAGYVLALIPAVLVLAAPGPASVSASGLGGAVAVLVALVMFAGPAAVGTAGLAGILAVTANTLYVSQAQRRIRKIADKGLEGEALLAAVAKAGGTSKFGGVVGAVLLAGVIVLPIALTITRTLPACDSGEVADLVERTILADVEANGTATDGLSFSGFVAADGSTENRRVCRFTIATDDGEAPLYFALDWIDRFQRTYQITFSERSGAN